MSSPRAALQVLLALAGRLKVGRQTKFYAAAIFTDSFRVALDKASARASYSVRNECTAGSPDGTKLYFQRLLCDRCIPLLDKDRPVALPPQEDTLCTLICLSKAARTPSKEGYVSMADIQIAAAEVLGPAYSSTDLKRIELWLEPRLNGEDMPQLSSDVIEDMLKHLQRTGMQAFAGAVSDEGLLGLCDTILEALLFCPGFQTCLTCGGSLLAAAVIGAAVLMNGKQSDRHGYPGVLALLSDIAGHPKEVISAQIRMMMSTVLQL